MRNLEHKQLKYVEFFSNEKIWQDTKLILLNKMTRKLFSSYLIYCKVSFSSRKLFRWWGKYFESRGKVDDALGCYRKAEDNLSLCRLLCEQDQPTKVGFVLKSSVELIDVFRRLNYVRIQEIKLLVIIWHDISKRKAIINKRSLIFNKHQRLVMLCDSVG